MAALWSGLSRLASHDGRGKEPIEFVDLMKFLHRTDSNTGPWMHRNRAMVVVCFFGVRRSAETLSFVLSDVTPMPNGDYQLLSLIHI